MPGQVKATRDSTPVSTEVTAAEADAEIKRSDVEVIPIEEL